MAINETVLDHIKRASNKKDQLHPNKKVYVSYLRQNANL